MSTVGTAPRQRPSAVARRTGYFAAIIANAVLLWVVHNVLAWDLLPFLTDDFTRVLPLITLSIIVSVAANIAYLFYDPVWFRALVDAVTSAVSLVATARLLAVFPFDFASATLETATRVLLVLVILGTSIAVVVNLVRGLVALARDS